jgi:uncharacterized membrane protein
MKKLALIAALLLALASTTAHAQTSSRSFYDSQGRFSGSTITTPRGDSSSFDRSGHFQGSASRRPDGSISIYDSNGHYLGSERRR